MDHLSTNEVKKANDACFLLEKKEDPHSSAGNFKSGMSQISSGLVR